MPGGNPICRSGNPIFEVGPGHLHPSGCDSELEVELHYFCGITPTSNSILIKVDKRLGKCLYFSGKVKTITCTLVGLGDKWQIIEC